jgi:hypothetical protein
MGDREPQSRGAGGGQRSYLGEALGRSRQPGYDAKLGHDTLHAGVREYGRSIAVGFLDPTVCGETSW